MSRVFWLDDLEPHDATARVGPKLGRLAELSAVGVEVPRGFAVTASACAEHEGAAGLTDVLAAALGRLDGTPAPLEVSALARDLHAHYLSCPVEPAVAAEVEAAYRELVAQVRDDVVAVRSSALGEDAREASFAGVFDSYLGLRGATDVVAAVRECWASRFSARALTYQLRRPWAAAQWMPMSVGVLELLPAYSSGVAFSAHPTTGARDRIVVEGTFGWGEAVVQGLVTPDRAELDAQDGRLLRYDVADKAVLSTLAPGGAGMVAVPMPGARRSEAVLDPGTLRAVGDVVRTIDQFYGHPVDVEWVVTQGPPRRCVVVQARPVTIAGPVPLPVWDPVDAAMRFAFGATRSPVGWVR